MMHTFKQVAHRIIPRQAFSLYHLLLALTGSFWYRFPSRSITVIGVTGTKGKSSTVEFLNAILEEAGCRTALSNSIRMKVAEKTVQKKSRLSMPGRFALQKFLRDAVDAKCTHALIEMTSEGAVVHRHRFISMDGLIFTNLAPEHIESHGSLEKYICAKLSIGRTLARSHKRPRIMVVNGMDPVSERFLSLAADIKLRFLLKDAEPYRTGGDGGTFRFDGRELTTLLPGAFSIENALAAATMAKALGVPPTPITRGIARLARVPGRAERIDRGQPFDVIVDYAHNPSSLKAIYSSFPGKRLVCVLGATGGGRDKWKRPEMGRLADEHCDEVILTNEDPYDEDPRAIVEEVRGGMRRTPTVEMDRRLAIRRAIRSAADGDVVLITGKGTDPSIEGPRGAKEPWSDARVAEEELRAYIDSGGV